ncbi:MAG: hypothetical protein JOZ81_22315 [Chloroflexi bacterium]|nr:hypothetical protein [Chloroflexota bacterium]
MQEQLDESIDAPYLVPTHLREAQSIGPIPLRTFYVLLAAGLLLGVPTGTVSRHLLNAEIGYCFALLPVVLSIPFAVPWLDPPAEHGALHLLTFFSQKTVRNLSWTRFPPVSELLEADGVGSFFGVVNAYRRRDTLSFCEQHDLARVQLRDGAVWIPTGGRLEPRAIYRVPTLNLDTASAATRRAARARWGAILNALPHPIQIVVRGRPASTLPVLDRIRAHGSAEACDLAAWLRAHLLGAQLVHRERYLVVPAQDQEQLTDRCASLEANMRRIGLPMERIVESGELRRTLAPFLGPRGQQFGPAIVDVASSSHIIVDGEYVRVFDLGKLPPTIVTDWAAPLLDGDVPVDVAIDVEPLELAWAKLQLDMRRNALESSAPSPGRHVAVQQIAGLRMAYECRQTLPMRMTVTILVRAFTDKELERRTKRIRQRAKDIGAQLRLLRWEQRAGWLAVLPVRRNPLDGRGVPVETGTVARTYPFSAGTLQLQGGVPFGVAAAAPATFTTAHPRAKNRHMCWYGTSGAGKGYSLRILLSREHFANGLRVYGIDQDEQQEYAGRFCAYLHGSRVSISSLAAAEAFVFDQVPNPNVVIWDLHQSDERDRGAILAALKARLVEYVLTHPGRAAFVVDEAVTITEHELGARTLGDLIRRARHFGIEVHVLTQRATDWFDTRIGRVIQSVAESKWFGQLEPRELYEIAASLGLTPEERERIERAGQGEGLLVTAGRRVWVNLYGQTSAAEYAMANTDILTI